MKRPLYQRSDGGRIGDLCRRLGDRLGVPRRPWMLATRIGPPDTERAYLIFQVSHDGESWMNVALPREWNEIESALNLPTHHERQEFFRDLGLVVGDAMQDCFERHELP